MADPTDNQPVVEQPETPVEQPVEQQPELEPEEQALANPQPEPETPENPETPVEPEQPATQEQPEMSRRKAQRLEKLEGLVERLRGPQTQQQRKAEGIDYSKLVDAEPEVIDQLSKASQDFGQTQYQAGLDQANAVRFHTRLEIDAPRVESRHPQFDKSNPETFQPGVVSAVNNFYLGMVGYDPQTDTVKNPEIRYGDFVDALAELGEAMFSNKTTKTTQNIARQAANTGLRPDGSSAKPLNWQGKDPSSMSEAELKAAIGATLPRDSQGRFTSQS